LKEHRDNSIGKQIMPSFAPQPIRTGYHFQIAQDELGYWVAREKEGLIGGIFRTQKDALRFALFETAGDNTYVRVLPVDGSLRAPSVNGSKQKSAPRLRRSLGDRCPVQKRRRRRPIGSARYLGL
jgi:hypothetical protein